MKIAELLEDITPRELNQVEQFADQLWQKLGVDVEFTRHFLDRVNDERNGKPITVDELISLFQREFKSNGIQISNMRRPEAVLKDLLSNINIPFVLKKNGDQKQLVSKTVMRKRNFMSPDPAYVVREDFQLTEGLGDWIFKKIDNLLGAPKPHPDAASRAVANAPPVLPDDIAEKLVADFMRKAEAQRLAQQAAEAQKTTVEKIVPYLTYFANNFIDKWRRIPKDVRQNALNDLSKRIVDLLMFILDAMIKGKK